MIMAMVSLTACASCTTDNDEPKKEEPGTENPGPSTGSEGIAGLGINKDNNMVTRISPFQKGKTDKLRQYASAAATICRL